MQKVTENYLSKVTRYFYFVTEQHCLKALSLILTDLVTYLPNAASWWCIYEYDR